MAGHSKWSNIKHTKARQDAKRGKIFTKLIREITVTAKMGGGDPAVNPRLRLAIERALNANLSKENIERAIKRGVGNEYTDNLTEVRYEGYGLHGVAVIVDCLTDNKNRTVAEVRYVFNKCGGNLSAEGSVAYLFAKKGVLSFAPGCNEDMIMAIALETEADDVRSNDDGSVDVFTKPQHFEEVKSALISAHLTPTRVNIKQIASTMVTLTQAQSEEITRLIDMLEDLDDVQFLYSNANIHENRCT